VGACLFYFDVISSYTLLSDIYPTKNISMKVLKTEPGRHKILGRRFFLSVMLKKLRRKYIKSGRREIINIIIHNERK